MAEKILINILSTEIVPNFIAAIELNPDRIIALASTEYRWQINLLEQYTVTHKTVEYRPYNFKEDFSIVANLIQEFSEDAEVFINFTGGTKIMSVSAVLGGILGGKNRKLTMIYVDTPSQKLHQISFADGKMEMREALPMQIPIPIQAHIAFAQEKIKSTDDALTAQQECWLEQIKKLMWKDEMRGFFGNQRKFHEGRNIKRRGAFNFNFSHTKKGRLSGSCDWKATQLSLLSPKGTQVELKGEGVIEFMAGNWLEAYVFSLCKKSDLFDAVLLNTKLSLKQETIAILQKKRKNVKDEKNELDVVVSKGVRSAIIECKSGSVTQDAVYKVATLRDHLLGSYGLAVIACRFKPEPGILEKAKDCDVSIFYKKELKNLPQQLRELIG